jgi:hypothetical protein
MFLMAIAAFVAGVSMGLRNPWLWLLGVPLILFGTILAAAAASACSPKAKLWTTMSVARVVAWLVLRSNRLR